jgi:glyoxylase-like metal-dependent hydrolase (beta-lactamase superfamily II)
MMVLLVPEDRVCLFGDACGENTFLFRPEASTVYAFRETLHKLLAMQDRYDRILRQHGTCESPKSLVEENLRTADLILAGKDDHIPFDYDGFHAFFAHKTDISTGKRVDGVSGNIVYSEDKIR